MQDLEKKTEQYAKTRETLLVHKRAYDAAVTRLQKTFLSKLRRSAAALKQHHDELETLIEANAAEFVKPKTQVVHGIKIGYQKQKGTIVIDDQDATLKRMEKVFGLDLDLYTRTKVSIDKKALEKCDGSTLKKLGVELQADTDKVVIRPIDDEIDKLITVLLKDTADIDLN